MKLKLAAATLTLQLSALSGAHAGEFSVFCSYKNDNLTKCASVISDIVTDKFIAKYPASKYQIFLYSNIHSFTNGGYSAYAISGVIPRGSAMFPVRYYSSTSINGGDKIFGAVQLAEFERDIYRTAAKSLMEACEISPNCDVYQERSK